MKGTHEVRKKKLKQSEFHCTHFSLNLLKFRYIQNFFRVLEQTHLYCQLTLCCCGLFIRKQCAQDITLGENVEKLVLSAVVVITTQALLDSN